MDKEKIHALEKQFTTLTDFECADGWILDFGGGGEGVIGILKGSHVVAIDLRKSELEEALERGCEALLIEMDGKDLKFLDNTFPTATAFFSLMYVKKDDLEKILSEIFRVLTPGGKFLIWDVNLEVPESVNKKIVAFYLDVTLPSGKVIETGYGTIKKHQLMQDFIDIGEKIGFQVNQAKVTGMQFYLELEKS
jgi:ubiquinone/menaquinone biosynthesis C-methylase UbiE